MFDKEQRDLLSLEANVTSEVSVYFRILEYLVLELTRSCLFLEWHLLDFLLLHSSHFLFRCSPWGTTDLILRSDFLDSVWNIDLFFNLDDLGHLIEDLY